MTSKTDRPLKNWIFRNKIITPLAATIIILAAISASIWVIIAQPSFTKSVKIPATASPDSLRTHVNTLSVVIGSRNLDNPVNLEKAANYIEAALNRSGATVGSQSFIVNEKTVRNITARFGIGKGDKIVIGAHYDTYGALAGADDNASGVAGLLELAEIIGASPKTREIELVAYTLEEPPFFRTKFMGSSVHAKRIAESKGPVTGVIVLEMIGCFKNKFFSQKYPFPLFYLGYPNRGNFIVVIGRWDQGGWIKRVKIEMNGSSTLPVYSIRAPSWVPGVDFSDHANYWKYGINAVMVTDTSFYRNKHYHTHSDAPETLDYQKMAQVVDAVNSVILSPNKNRLY